MADRLSLGPVQIFDADVLSINEALRQLSERIDELKGLRGRTLIYDRVRADDPTESQDALVYPNIYADHGALGGLTDDDHTQYLLLAGRAPSQTIAGTISSTGAWTVSSAGSLKKDEGANGTTALARFPMGELAINANAAATVITTGDTWTRFDAATTLTTDSYLFDEPQNGRLRYTGTVTKMFHIACTLSVTSAGANDVMRAVIIQNATVNASKEYSTGTILTAGEVKQKLSGAADTGSTAIHVMAELAQNDFLELFIKNVTDTDDLTVEYMNLFAMGVSGGHD